MQGLKHSQKVKIPQKEEEETKFPLAFHAEDKKRSVSQKACWTKYVNISACTKFQTSRGLWGQGRVGGRPDLPDHTDPRGADLPDIHSRNFLVLFRP